MEPARRTTFLNGCVRTVGVLAVTLLAAGCQGPGQTAPPSRTAASQPADVAPITNTDACASRLHDLCGPLLLYYAIHKQVPDRIEELGQVPGFEEVRDFTCPVSGRPYVYNPAGPAGLEAGSRVIIYDALPSHSGMRWGVSVAAPGGGAPLIAKVIALPESRFADQGGAQGEPAAKDPSQ
jgi:hypothetical protein